MSIPTCILYLKGSLHSSNRLLYISQLAKTNTPSKSNHQQSGTLGTVLHHTRTRTKQSELGPDKCHWDVEIAWLG